MATKPCCHPSSIPSLPHPWTSLSFTRSISCLQQPWSSELSLPQAGLTAPGSPRVLSLKWDVHRLQMFNRVRQKEKQMGRDLQTGTLFFPCLPPLFCLSLRILMWNTSGENNCKWLQSCRALTNLFLMGCLEQSIKSYLGPQPSRSWELFPRWEYNKDAPSSKIKHMCALLGRSLWGNSIYLFYFNF